MPVKVIYGDDLGIGNFRNAQDLFAATDNTLYIVDSGNNRIVRIDSSFTVLDIYREFEYGGMIHTFNNPQGVFVTEQGHMFVADTYNMRIVHFDADGSCINIIGAPETDNPGAFPEYFRFRPSHVAVNSYGRVYVTVEGLYEGLIELDLDGNFRTFLGAPRVRLSPWQYFWYRIASDEQRSRMALLLPTEYSSVHLDDRGFILTTVASSDVAVEQLIRKLNPAGKDILRRDGFHPPMGDIHPGTDSQITGYSILVDIVGRENDIYSVLDRRRGRIFTYDGHGNLLFINPATTEIAVEDLVSGNIWYSNPQNRHSERGLALQKTSSQFSIFHDPHNVEKNNYRYSTAYDQFAIKLIPNGVRVEYQIVEEWRPEHYVPVMISQDRMEQMILANIEEESARGEVLGAYDLIMLKPADGQVRSSIPGLDKERIFGGYTLEVLNEDYLAREAELAGLEEELKELEQRLPLDDDPDLHEQKAALEHCTHRQLIKPRYLCAAGL